jgi:hypothetical protein
MRGFCTEREVSSWSTPPLTASTADSDRQRCTSPAREERTNVKSLSQQNQSATEEELRV